MRYTKKKPHNKKTFLLPKKKCVVATTKYCSSRLWPGVVNAALSDSIVEEMVEYSVMVSSRVEAAYFVMVSSRVEAEERSGGVDVDVRIALTSEPTSENTTL